MKKKEITRQDLLNRIDILISGDCYRPDVERYFILKGGRGFVTILNKLFYEKIQLLKNDGMSFGKGVIKNLFIPGIGFLEIQYDSKFDEGFNIEINQEIVNGLPECCYSGELFDEEISLGFMTTLIEAPYQNLEDLLKGLNTTIARFEQDIASFKEELANLEQAEKQN